MLISQVFYLLRLNCAQWLVFSVYSIRKDSHFSEIILSICVLKSSKINHIFSNTVLVECLSVDEGIYG